MTRVCNILEIDSSKAGNSGLLAMMVSQKVINCWKINLTTRESQIMVCKIIFLCGHCGFVMILCNFRLVKIASDFVKKFYLTEY